MTSFSPRLLLVPTKHAHELVSCRQPGNEVLLFHVSSEKEFLTNTPWPKRPPPHSTVSRAKTMICPCPSLQDCYMHSPLAYIMPILARPTCFDLCHAVAQGTSHGANGCPFGCGSHSLPGRRSAKHPWARNGVLK